MIFRSECYAGRIQSLFVDEGAQVQAGQLVAELDPVRYEAARDRATGEVAAQREVLNRLLAGSRPEEIAAARARKHLIIEKPVCLRLDDLRDPAIRARLAAIWRNPLGLDPTRRTARATREIAIRLARVAQSLEGRYHPEAVAGFLSRCLFYIDLNMVRAGAVEQPAQWDACGCRELGLAEEQPRRGAVIDRKRLLDCLEFGGNWQAFAEWHRRTLGELVSSGWRVREPVSRAVPCALKRLFLKSLLLST